jgi:uncharacterized protein (TIGR00730 family)
MADPALERERPPTSGSSATAPPQRADEIFLEGPRSRFDELITLFRVLLDFLRGFRVLHFVGPCVTVFGSARLKESHPSYELARKMGAATAQLGFTVMTGGGPGIMEAANRGAKDVNGRSVGCNIELEFEQQPNAFLDRCVTLHYFFVRKTLLVKYSYAFVVIQTGKIKNFPVVVMGTDYWRDLLKMLEKMADEGMIDRSDLDLIFATDSVEEAVAYIREKAITPFGLKLVVRRHLAWLGERALG